ncbi:winged helix-turn-helix domain-containing protein [Lentzea alba]|uniref:winged helix-turn-helix domain-containing protein n=1 Tax=Lentzea alba TaxID=2714351 RepID=UPI0039BEDCBD
MAKAGACQPQSVAAEREARARAFLDGGVEALLTGLHPTIRWVRPVLEIHGLPHASVHLNGKGLVLQPIFSPGGTVTLTDGVLTYPVDPEALVPRGATPSTVVRLMGRTRAAALDFIASGDSRSSGEIAKYLAISPSSASEHASLLRSAGLIISLRVRNTVRHMVTPLGRALLEPQRATARSIKPA